MPGVMERKDTQPRKVVILGSTGSIGTSALKVAREIPDYMEVVGLAAGRQAEELAAQAREFGVKHLAIADEGLRETVIDSAPANSEVHVGAQGLRELACLPEADMVLISIVGTAGLQPALDAIEAGKDLAVASKEILVMAGEIVMTAARRPGSRSSRSTVNTMPFFSAWKGMQGGQRPCGACC